MCDRHKKMQHIDEYLPIVGYYGKRISVQVNTGSETKVEQFHEETTNINKIIGRYRRSGVLPENRVGQYIDSSEVPELLEARLQMTAALDAYDQLPKSITDQFKDVDEFLQYVENQEQIIAKPVETPPAPSNQEDENRPPLPSPADLNNSAPKTPPAE